MKVSFVVSIAHSLFPAGLENQISETKLALESRGVEVQIVGPEHSDLGDLVHTFGTFDYQWVVCEACLERAIPYVSSPVFLPKRGGSALKRDRIIKEALGSYPRATRKQFRAAKRLFTLTETEEANLSNYFGVDQSVFRRVPNGVHEVFRNASPEVFRPIAPTSNRFVVHVGTFSPRKNQLSAIYAAKANDCELLLIGPERDESYAAKCRAAAGPETHFVGSLPLNSEVLAGAYAAAEALVFPTAQEVLSLSAIEAGSSGAPMVLGDGWGAQSVFGDWAYYCDVRSQKSINQALKFALAENPEKRRGRKAWFADRFSWSNIVDRLLGEYSVVLGI